ncbi:MAG TPA: bifunctional lysylphosphatidylglycerol flippase/synthetase MprF [Gemmatimonadales bacterium]|nr:bifunctional lysylphosphatidylglycerol flippase/synthetase MprF [Gemmatimonadales bacterium]
MPMATERRGRTETQQPLAASQVAATDETGARASGTGRWARIAPVTAAVVFLLALGAVHHALSGISYGTLWRAILALSPGQVGLATAFTVAGYLALTGYDVLALRYVRHPLPYRQTGLASFISFSLSNSVGLAMLTGASVRSRLYSAWGLSTTLIGRIIGFTAATLWLGVLFVAGTALVLEPAAIAPLLHLTPGLARAAGVAALALVALYFGWCVRGRPLLLFRGWRFEPPATALALGQLAASTADWVAAAGVLYVLLPSGAAPSFPVFAGMFVVAQALGLASHVPGGLGVFEGAVLLLAGGAIPAAELAGALLVFRAIYYLVPLLVATALLAAHEALRHRERLGTISRTARTLVAGFTAPLIAVAVFTTGAVLLVSGATPTVNWRLRLLTEFVPLPLLEVSHFAASVVGMALVLLAYALSRRLRDAWGLTAVLLATAVVTSLLKGLDFEEATLALITLGCLIPARDRFHRRGSLLAERWTRGWVAAVTVALSASVWLGFFAYRHVEYSGELWWQFEFGADAPRFLRATVGAAAVALALALVRLLRPASHRRPTPAATDLDRTAAVIAGAEQTQANLALLGDKQILFSDSGRSFLMYAVRGRSWVVLGDPVGDASEFGDLGWRFRELCDRHGGWPVFYEVSRHRLPLYLEQGLTLLKLGEEARVPLPTFTLDGKGRASLRRWKNACEKAGCSVEMLPAGASDRYLPELERVSNEWLATRKTREKGFSLGRFAPDYLRRFPLALVWLEGRIVAFATLWTTSTRDELTVDLMRYTADAPSNVMTYLFVQLMLWGREQGYRWFNLGMAPLSGLGNRALAPLWHRLGAFVFRHGENFYHFKGLREYKSRFDPVWEPRYLASPGGLALPFILTDIATLIAGGLKGVFAK